jgi:hypothetical protein
MKKIFFFVIYAFAFAIFSKFIYTEYEDIKIRKMANKGGFPAAIKNYKKEVDSLAKVFDLPAAYLMSVIILESSGRKNTPVRYEQSIYDQLILLKKGKIDKFENLKPADLKRVSDKTIKALSCSYGPFQIMGYKAFILKVPLDTLKGKKNLYYSVKWINITYGDFLRNGDFKDAYHIHNAGKKFPNDGISQTHDPDYVRNGLKYQQYFEKVIYKNKK